MVPCEFLLRPLASSLSGPPWDAFRPQAALPDLLDKNRSTVSMVVSHRQIYSGADGEPLGPMGSTLSDLNLFAKTVVDAQPWLKDPKALPIPWREVRLPKKLKFGVIWNDGMVTPTPPVRRALKATVDKLRQAGHEVIDWDASSHSTALKILVCLASRVTTIADDRLRLAFS